MSTTTPDRQPPLRVIPDDAVLRLGEAQALLGLPAGTLPREARLGRLRVAKRAGLCWTTGRWVREWLEGGEVHRRPAEPAGESAPTANGRAH